jgi:hypothetical protein
MPEPENPHAAIIQRYLDRHWAEPVMWTPEMLLKANAYQFVTQEPAPKRVTNQRKRKR